MPDISNSILSDLTIYSKYARYLPELERRETWKENSNRVRRMHEKKFPDQVDTIRKAFKFDEDKKVLASMRSHQFAGLPIERNNIKIFNCTYLNINNYRDFSEIMFLLLSGCGVGYSVSYQHVNKLPQIVQPKKGRKFLIGDTVEGWSDAIRHLFQAYMRGSSLPLFDYSDIRAKGTPLKVSGGKAPGFGPLKTCIDNIENILKSKKIGEQLRSIDVHDMICHISDAVLSGGVRRSSAIVLFDVDDEDMLNAKGFLDVNPIEFTLNENVWIGKIEHDSGIYDITLSKYEYEQLSATGKIAWYHLFPQRARANNSVILYRDNVEGLTGATEDDFKAIWNKCRLSGAGEPGIFWSSNPSMGTNPCLTGDAIVHLADGQNVSIKDLSDKGEDVEVFCTDNDLNIVIRTMRNPRITGYDKEVFAIEFNNGSVVKATEDHRFKISNGEYKKVKDMNCGDVLFTLSSVNYPVVEDLTYRHIKSISSCGKETVYCGTVDEHHNFFVGVYDYTEFEMPRFFFINSENCGEVSLKSGGTCNLTEINLSDCLDQQDLLDRVWAATIIGTLQASYTDFHYLSEKWKKNCEQEALLGVSMTGIGDVDYTKFDFEEAALYAKTTNESFAKEIGINSAARITCVKPAGTTSCVVGSASGIHARHSQYYIRRIRYNKNEPLAIHLMNHHPELVEEDKFNPNGIVVSIPQKSPDDSILRTESALDTLERVKHFNQHWIQPGHVRGDNPHNVSCTISVKDNEWDIVGQWMWENREYYTGIAVLPYSNHTYVQAPFEECTEETYNEMYTHLQTVDLSKVSEFADLTSLSEQAACAGGACEIF